MDFYFVHLTIICALTGTLAMVFLYIYLYILHRERYMGVWVLCWFIHFLRYIVFDSRLFIFDKTTSLTIVYQLLFVYNALLFVYAINLFVGKPVKRYWLYTSFIVSILGALATILNLSVSYQYAPVSWFATIALITVGITFIRDLKVKGIGQYITGYSFILWGVTTAVIPFTATESGYSLWIALICGILRLIIAAGTLLVYFEKIREDLLNKEAYFRLLTENAVDVIYRYRLLPEARFEYISPSIFTMTGHPPDDFYADPKLMRNLVHPDDLFAFKDSVLNSRKYISSPFSFRLIRKDNKIIWVEGKCIPKHDDNGNLVILEGVSRDVTTRKELEELTVRADRQNMVGEMAASVAHVIRNPLTTVRGYLQIMAKKEELSKYKNRIDIMLEELTKANAVISEYLMLTKNKRTELKSCSLNSIIEKMFPLIQASAITTNVDVRLDLKDIPSLNLDEEEIRQLLINLTKNAIEAMPKGGELIITTNLEENRAILSVIDQGIGMPDHILKNLGTPFLTTKTEGIGLGLPMCHRIVNRHNASIEVKSGDHGTIFIICFDPSLVV